jgi:hypothetical protein
VLCAKYYLSDQSKENEMGEACNMSGREGEEKFIESFGGKT